MNAECLLAQYERIANAPDAVARLRRFVLDLAVRGKLVPQNPSDVPPIERLKQARRRLETAAATTRRLRWKASVAIVASETDKDIPSGWIAARVNDTGLYVNGLAFKPSDWKKEGLPIIRIQNLTDPAREFNFAEGDFPDEVLVRDCDLLVSWSATLEAFRWNRGLAVLNQHIFRVIPDEGLTTRDFLLLLLRNAIREMADSEHAHGLVMTHINREPFLNHVVLIPPLAEQHRIITKFDELMALCDRLEAARADREAARDRFMAASLARLNAPDPGTFRDDAHFVLDVLPALTARADQIKQLRQTILNLAVRGKLMPQDTHDESASELLKRIGADKERSRQRTRAVDEQVAPFVLPLSWKWVALGELISAGPQNGISPKPSNRHDAPKAITLTATTRGVFDPTCFKRVEANVPDDSDLWLREGDLLFQRGNTREYVGIAAICNGPPRTFLFPDLIMRVRLSVLLDLRFVHLAVISPPARDYFAANASGASATMPKINQATLVSLPIPLPPLAEQHRIVSKVDELMALCDRLEATLATADELRRRLLEALLAEALALNDTHELAAAE